MSFTVPEDVGKGLLVTEPAPSATELGFVACAPWPKAEVFCPSAWAPAPTASALVPIAVAPGPTADADRKSTRLNSSHVRISYAVFCLKKKTKKHKRSNTKH